jgi:hypothetical protein
MPKLLTGSRQSSDSQGGDTGDLPEWHSVKDFNCYLDWAWPVVPPFQGCFWLLLLTQDFVLGFAMPPFQGYQAYLRAIRDRPLSVAFFPSGSAQRYLIRIPVSDSPRGFSTSDSIAVHLRARRRLCGRHGLIIRGYGQRAEVLARHDLREKTLSEKSISAVEC